MTEWRSIALWRVGRQRVRWDCDVRENLGKMEDSELEYDVCGQRNMEENCGACQNS